MSSGIKLANQNRDMAEDSYQTMPSPPSRDNPINRYLANQIARCEIACAARNIDLIIATILFQIVVHPTGSQIRR
jgi:hypothetical protein